jgi:nucleotide-binding universal stress UspA family protein
MTTRTVRPIGEILVATDFSQASGTAVRVAHAYARAFQVRLHVLHVTRLDEPGLTKLFAQIVDELGTAVPVLMAAHAGDPAGEIVGYAKRCNVDLIVMGTHGRTGFSRVLLGSVAERVARTAPCPVLVVPLAAAPATEEPRLPPPTAHRCVVCSRESPDLICEPCREHIRGEALEAKHREERGARF